MERLHARFRKGRGRIDLTGKERPRARRVEYGQCAYNNHRNRVKDGEEREGERNMYSLLLQAGN